MMMPKKNLLNADEEMKCFFLLIWRVLSSLFFHYLAFFSLLTMMLNMRKGAEQILISKVWKIFGTANMSSWSFFTNDIKENFTDFFPFSAAVNHSTKVDVFFSVLIVCWESSSQNVSWILKRCEKCQLQNFDLVHLSTKYLHVVENVRIFVEMGKYRGKCKWTTNFFFVTLSLSFNYNEGWKQTNFTLGNSSLFTMKLFIWVFFDHFRCCCTLITQQL